MDASKIKDLWEAFFYPVMNTFLVLLATAIFLGKDERKRIVASWGKTVDRIVFGEEKPKSKKQARKEKKSNNTRSDTASLKNPEANDKSTVQDRLPHNPVTAETPTDKATPPKILGALKKAIQEVLTKPATWIFFCFLFSFAVNKLLIYISYVFPISFGYTNVKMSIGTVSKETFARIWARYPTWSFAGLCEKICEVGKNASYIQGHDSSIVNNLNHVFMGICILFIIFSVISFIKKKAKLGLRFLAGTLAALFLVVLLFLNQYWVQKKIFKDSANYMLYTESIKEEEEKAEAGGTNIDEAEAARKDKEAYDMAMSKYESEYRAFGTNNGFLYYDDNQLYIYEGFYVIFNWLLD